MVSQVTENGAVGNYWTFRKPCLLCLAGFQLANVALRKRVYCHLLLWRSLHIFISLVQMGIGGERKKVFLKIPVYLFVFGSPQLHPRCTSLPVFHKLELGRVRYCQDGNSFLESYG